MASFKPKKISRVFIDSSVLVAAAISTTGAGREIINQGFTKKLNLYISSDVLEETQRNLKLKAPKTLPYFSKFQESFIAKLANPSLNQILKVAKQVEPKDAPIVAGAMKAKADFLVTYDRKHLLNQKQIINNYFHIVVVTPDDVI